jgi:excisionase family DNA binding protein
MPPIFVDARELAGRLDVRYDTVLTWVRRGKIPHVRDGRGRLLFNLDSVLTSLRTAAATDPAGERGGVPMTRCPEPLAAPRPRSVLAERAERRSRRATKGGA